MFLLVLLEYQEIQKKKHFAKPDYTDLYFHISSVPCQMLYSLERENTVTHTYTDTHIHTYTVTHIYK